MLNRSPPLRLDAHGRPCDADTRLLAAVRETRFASGTFCPYCAQRGAIRWGRFSGRQRYRCKACGRTFSDLTCTPLAYTKRLNRWPRYFQSMRHSSTVRAAACDTGIHPSTAFRWRHATLSGTRIREQSFLCGCIEVTQIAFALSDKGMRGLEDSRRCGARSHAGLRNTTPVDWIVMLRSRSGQLHSLSFKHGVPNVTELVRYFMQHVERGSTMVCRSATGRTCAAAMRQAGHAVSVINATSDRDVFHHTDNIDAYSWRMKDWLLRFRGVATRYLDNYLAWHRLLDGDHLERWLRSCAGKGDERPLPPTVPANTVSQGLSSQRDPPSRTSFGRKTRPRRIRIRTPSGPEAR